MNAREYLLICLSEECSEVAQRISKALRFSSEECQPNQFFTNAERITLELVDLIAVMEMLVDSRIITDPRVEYTGIKKKKKKVIKFMDYSEKIGVLDA